MISSKIVVHTDTLLLYEQFRLRDRQVSFFIADSYFICDGGEGSAPV
ncbi:hypothetical protein ABIE27_004282 [Paenibacillus sp. 4624]|jgi:hypothetical protein